MSPRKKSVDKSANFEQFIEETSDYLPKANQQLAKPIGDALQRVPPSTIKEKNPSQDKQNNKHSNKRSNAPTNKRKKKTSIGDLFGEPVAKEKIVNTTLQLPESLNGRLKEFCDRFGTSKNKVVITLVEALLEEKGF